MSKILSLLVIFALFLGACNSAVQPPPMRQIISADIPEGTVFQPIAEVQEFDVLPSIKILPDPDDPKRGIAAVKLMIVSKSSSDLRNVHAAVWLPSEVRKYTPLALIGTNLEKSHIDLSPQQPKMGILSSIRFANFDENESIRAAFVGSTRVKVIWDGGVRFFEFPADRWEVEIVPHQ